MLQQEQRRHAVTSPSRIEKVDCAAVPAVSPPMTKVKRNPRMKSMGTRTTGLPSHRVASQGKTWIPIGMAMAALAAEKKPSDKSGSPVANMWCTQSPKERNPTDSAASASQV